MQIEINTLLSFWDFLERKLGNCAGIYFQVVKLIKKKAKERAKMHNIILN